MLTCCCPLCLLLSKCWLCKHKCFRPFSHTVEPMDADDWLKSVEKKLQVVQCNNHEKVLLDSHQLSGPRDD
jgi:hypothetical protein